MADNVAVTAGSGTTIAADEVTDGTLGSCKVQFVKLMDGTLDGTTKAAVGSNGLATDVKAVVPGTGATNLGKAEDAAHTSGDVGVLALGRRSDTVSSSAGTDGDYATINLDANGRLYTNAQATGNVASGASDSGNPVKVGGIYNSSPITLTNGQRGDAQLDASGYLKVNVAAGGASGGTSSSFGSAVPSTGTAIGASDGTNMQAPRVFDGDTGVGTEYVLGAVLRKTASGGTVEAGTSSNPLRTDPTGTTAQPVTDNGGSLTVDNAGTFAVQATIAAGATNIAKAEDVASADADVGVPAMAVRKATPANTSGTDGDYEMLQISAGRLWTSANIDQLAGTTTDTNSGNKSAGTLRVVLATDQPQLTNKLLVTPDANSAVNVAQINGVTPLMGAGNTGTGSPRVTIATDQAAFSVNATLQTGTNSFGDVRAITTSVTPGTSAAHLGKAEDAASASGDTGVFILGVRNDTPSSLTSANGDYAGLTTNAYNQLHVSTYAVTTISQTPTVSTTPAYSAGDAVGGKLTFASATRISAYSGTVTSVSIVDQNKQAAVMDLILFNADPSGTTFTDNSALDIADADMTKIFARIPLVDWCGFNDNGACVMNNLNIPFVLASGSSIYGSLITRGTPTFAATSDIIVNVTIVQD